MRGYGEVDLAQRMGRVSALALYHDVIEWLSAATSEAEVQRGPTLSDCGSKMRSSVMLLWSV